MPGAASRGDFTGPDGRLNYRHTLTSRDGVDDFYETFFNWPQLYLLGGADDLLAESERHWEGVTAQLTELGMLSGEYERGYDWFHQGESLLLLYFLTMADPARWARAGGAVRGTVRRPRARQLRPGPPHHPPPAQRLGSRPRPACSTGRTTRGLTGRRKATASRSTGCCPRARPCRNATRTRG